MTIEQVVVGLVLTAISVGASYYLSSQASKAARKVQPTFEPSQIGQASVIPWLHGKKRLPVIVAWTGERSQFFNRQKGSKGKKTTTGPFFREGAWWLLCVGPAQGITRIWMDDALVLGPNQQILVEDPSPLIVTIGEDGITPDLCPSGTSFIAGPGFEINATAETYVGTRYQVFWGDDELDAPELEDVTGSVSLYPRVCAIRVHDCPLGTSPRWPQCDVEVKSLGPSGAGTIDPCDYMETRSLASGTPTGGAEYLDSTEIDGSGDVVVSNPGTGGTGYSIDEGTYYLFRFEPNERATVQFIKAAGDAAVDVRIDYVRIFLKNASSGDEIDLFESTEDPDLPRLVDGTDFGCWSGATPGDFVLSREFPLRYVDIPAGGYRIGYEFHANVEPTGLGYPVAVNINIGLQLVVDPVFGAPSRFLNRILFGEFPQGVGLSTDDIDEDAIDDLYALLDSEEPDGAQGEVVLIDKAEKASDAIAAWMAERAVVASHDWETGKLVFRAIRPETEARTIEAGLDEAALPEIVSFNGDLRPSRVDYVFRDYDREWQETLLDEADDSHADEVSAVQAQRVDITTVSTFGEASQVAQRRAAEALGNQTVYDLGLMRECARLKVGDLIKLAPEFEVGPALRVLSIQGNDQSESKAIKAAIDTYAIEAVEYAGDDSGGTPSPSVDLQPDPAFEFIEVPDDLIRVAGLDRPSILIVRARDNATVLRADVLLSDDGTNYDDVDSMQTASFAGELTEEFPLGAWDVDQGPTLDALGIPDTDGLQDLTSNEAAWRRGDQAMLVGSEVCFLRKLTPLGGGSWRPEGILRGCYDTERQAWPVGTKVFVFPISEALNLFSPSLQPGATLRLKTLPRAANAIIDPLDVTPVTHDLVGKGIVPQAVTALKVSEPQLGASSYDSGDDLQVTWGYRNPVTPRTGAGHQGYGESTTQDPIRGTFEVTVLDDMDVEVHVENVGTDLFFDIANADLVTWLGAEGDFTVVVRNVDGGLRSEARSVQITLN